MPTIRPVLMLALALFLSAGAIAASEPAQAAREIKWPDLVPKLPPIKDPLAALNSEERIELETVLWVRQLTDAEREERKEIVEEARKYEEAFREKGIIIDDLISDYAKYDAAITKRQGKVKTEFDGQEISIKGYLLPLEFNEDGETEFLLVPYIGACIHVPPPPPNQIVLVSLSKAFKAREVFTPVKITGNLATKSTSRKLYLVDGSADISVGYHLSKSSIEIIDD